jgi:long-chain acyl-CoA synthetase
MQYSWERKLGPYRNKYFTGDWPTIVEMFLITKDRFPERNCFTTFNPERFTLNYKEVYENIIRISGYLKASGLEIGDKVMIDGANSIQWGLAYLAVHFAGGITVPLDFQMHPDRIIKLCKFADCKFILADTSILKKIANEEKGKEFLDSMGAVVTLNKKCEFGPSLWDVKSDKTFEIEKSNIDATAAILFTSGTTGNEKGVVLTQKNIITDIYQACDDDFLDLTENEIMYALLPLHHSYCCTTVLLETVCNGSECVFGHGIVVSRMINDLIRGKVNFFMGIPLLYNKLLAGMMKEVKKKGIFVNTLVHLLMHINGFFKSHFGLNPFRGFFNKKILSKMGLDHNKILICGAGPLAPEVFKQYQQLGLDFVQGYGLTETSPVVTLNPVSKFKVESVGRVFPLNECKILDPDENGIGEIAFRGPNNCKGYYKDEVNTKELFTEDGFLKTGDLGYLDDENYLYLKGRAKNIIVTEGGKNVFPEEIEDLFQLFPSVNQILIRGYQEKKNVPAECIEAVVYPDPQYFKENEVDISETIDEVIKKVNKELSGYKKISKITILDNPMIVTSTKKIKRNLIEK